MSESFSPLCVECRPFAVWAEAWWLSHGELELVFVPKLARLMRIARGAGGPNALWVFTEAATHPVEGWENAGGEKLWFWPQRDWRERMGRDWPPPETSASEVRAEPWGLSWRLPSYAGFGLELRRELRFSAADSRGFELITRVESGFEAESEDALSRVLPWSVVQIPTPAQPVRVVAAPGAKWRAMHAPKGVAEPMAREDGGWDLSCVTPTSLKYGFEADVLAAATSAGWLTIAAKSDAAAWSSEWADAPVRAQVFSTAPDGGSLPPGTEPYVELEFLAAPDSSEWVLSFRLE